MLILHQHLPPEMWHKRPLPGIAPVEGDWLRVDEAYAGQMAERRRLLDTRPEAVLAVQDVAAEACAEVLALVEADLPRLGFERRGDGWLCPDGVHVTRGAPLETLGRLVQADFCILQKPEGDAEHVLTAAVLCFPASWLLSEKIGRPLVGIHKPVAEYDANIAKRVQRLFDGVQVGRPIWRSNRLWYADAALFQPRSETARRAREIETPPFMRSERQVLLRLPESEAVVFAIHTYVLARENVPDVVVSDE